MSLELLIEGKEEPVKIEITQFKRDSVYVVEVKIPLKSIGIDLPLNGKVISFGRWIGINTTEDCIVIENYNLPIKRVRGKIVINNKQYSFEGLSNLDCYLLPKFFCDCCGRISTSYFLKDGYFIKRFKVERDKN